MRLALHKAWEYQGLTYPNPAVGAVVIKNGRLLSLQAHQKAGTSHAEVLALIEAYCSLSSSSIFFDPLDASFSHDFLLSLDNGFFNECTMYVTLEPCSHHGKTPSCATLLAKLSLKRVVIATSDPIKGHDGGMRLLSNVTFGVLQSEAEILIEPFKIWQKKAFVLFKLAQTSNGRIGGGYLSATDSLYHVHQLRGVCDRLLIGGNTVRADRPTLDCRFAGELAPDVTIYSRQKTFDLTIPLFGVPNRDVIITDELDFLEIPSFVLVEGGEGMLRVLAQRLDWLLLYQTPKLSTNPLSYNIDMNLQFLHHQYGKRDILIWSKNLGH